ncbi:MAG: HAD family hydrolase [Phycisphaerae bacterium]|jgi:FMN phosphatase YigB (HAD superfamily)
MNAAEGPATASGGRRAGAPSEHGGAPLLTVDVWDTLLRRRCHPDEIKLFTARCLWLRLGARLRAEMDSPWRLFRLRQSGEDELARRSRAAGFDDEYCVEDVLEAWLAAAVAEPLGAAESARLRAELLEAEIAQECAMAYADEDVGAVLAAQRGHPPVVLSDFYLGAVHLGRVLAHARPGLRPRALVVSCDERVNKRSGRLFEHVYRRFGVAPSAHVHVGDDPHSDVAVPRRLGARAVRYRARQADRRRAQFGRMFARRAETAAPCVRTLLAELAAAPPPPDLPDGDPATLFRFGRRFALLFYAFVLYCVERALRCGAERVYYFAREGVFLRELHERIRSAAPLGVPVPPSEVLEVSRLATFLPSLRELSPAELMRVWNLYSTQSMAALCEALGIDPPRCAACCARHGIAPDEPISRPWQDARVLALLADPALRQQWDAARRESHRLLLAYLAERGIAPGHGHVFIVDIGWRGTIQDNLAYLLPDVSIEGAYFALKKLLNEQPPNVQKHVFGPDENRGDPDAALTIHHVPPLEMLMNCAGGSVRGYAQGPDGVVAVRQADPGEDAVFAKYTRHFQRGVLDAADAISSHVQAHALTAQELRPHAIGLLHEIVCRPPRELARAYFSLRHDERFGAGRRLEPRRPFPYGLAVGGLFSRRRRGELVRALDETGWPQGFLCHHGLRPLCLIYNRALRWRRRAELGA